MRYLLIVVSLQWLLILHELGHFFVARLFGMKTYPFTVGFGPTLLSFRRGAVLFKAIPVGASARIYGMNPHEVEESPADPTSFTFHRRWKRALVIASGSAINAALAVALLVGLHIVGTHVPVPMTVGSIAPGSEAARVRLMSGDRIETLNQEPIHQWSDLVQAIADRPGRAITLGVVRGSEQLQFTVRPQPDSTASGRLGITQQYVFRQQRAWDAVKSAFGYIRHLAVEAHSILSRLAHGRRSTDVMRQVLETAPRSVDTALRGLAALSLSLAAFFVIPLPGLDGGRLLFLTLEAIFRKSVHPMLETTLHALGSLALLGVLLAIPVREVMAILQSMHALHAATDGRASKTSRGVDGGSPGVDASGRLP